MFKALRDNGDLQKNLQSIFVGGWEPKSSTSHASTTGWNPRDEQKKDTVGSLGNGPELCWEASGDVVPLNLSAMTEEEKEVRQDGR